MKNRTLVIGTNVLLDTLAISGELHVCDPCYLPDVYGFSSVGATIDVRPGRWGLFLSRVMVRSPLPRASEHVEISNRAAGVIHQSVMLRKGFQWERARSRVSVDSGRVVFANSSTYDPDHDRLHTIDDIVAHDIQTAIVSSGRGDGDYDLYVVRDGIDIVGVSCVFLPNIVTDERAKAQEQGEAFVCERGRVDSYQEYSERALRDQISRGSIQP